jgi:hypothetical protein
VTRASFVLVLTILGIGPAFAQSTDFAPAAPAAEAPAAADPEAQAQPLPAQAQIDELRRQLAILAAEIEQLRSGEDETIEVSDERRRALGLAPSAAAAFRRKNAGISFAGYGEMLVENFDNTNESGGAGAPTTRFDFLRAVLYTGYRFNDRFLFNSEIEVEHGNEIYVEFAFVDFAATDNLNLRGGLLLIPLGLVNEFHEPNVFLGARRPETEQRIIPSTWRENGAGLLGAYGPVSFRAFVTNGFNGAGFTSAGLRGGRQRGISARGANLAFSGRLDVTPVPGITGGVGLYKGGSGQEQVILDGERLDVDTTVFEAHAYGQWRGADVRGLFARATIDRAGDVTRALRLATTAPIASTMNGGYVQVGYNLLSQTSSELAITPYVRYEEVDTQAEIPAGFTRDLSRDGRFRTVGIDIKPIPNVVLKTEYQWLTNAAGSGRNQFNVNLGYAF